MFTDGVYKVFTEPNKVYNPMFGKIFRQIFDSSIAEDYLTRLVFMDMIVLAEDDGVVPFTSESLSRRTNVPLEIVQKAVQKLTQKDPSSKTPSLDGQRIMVLDPERGCGWQIVNYEKFRNIRSEGQRKEYMRSYMQSYRKGERKRDVNSCKQTLTSVNSVNHVLAKEYSSPSPSSSSSQDRGVGEGATEIPDLAHAIDMVMSIGIPKEFCELVYSKWYEREGKDGSGQQVEWLRHVRGRWEREQTAWRNGTHSYFKSHPKPECKAEGNGTNWEAYQKSEAEKLKEALSKPMIQVRRNPKSDNDNHS